MVIFTKKIFEKLFLSEVSIRESNQKSQGNKKIFKNSDLEIIKKDILLNASALSQYKDIGLLIDKAPSNKSVEFEKDPYQLFIKVEEELTHFQNITTDSAKPPINMICENTIKDTITNEGITNEKEMVSPIANLSSANERVAHILKDTKNYNHRDVILSQTKQINEEPSPIENDVPKLTTQEGMY
ncbi:uncharacterized protein HGUI_03930 [Hanseniaspora guilliermondii]|uniref:Uncharacterized protein n=1 Tax=Hanseniaspora guilliermondii TaxID=56406 RepID=A0A1L0CT24_9ASCO|nr:uncharacterized protein HGUI_03930 [Hanseniaspora guilliermondii]